MLGKEVTFLAERRGLLSKRMGLLVKGRGLLRKRVGLLKKKKKDKRLPLRLISIASSEVGLPG